MAKLVAKLYVYVIILVLYGLCPSSALIQNPKKYNEIIKQNINENGKEVWKQKHDGVYNDPKLYTNHVKNRSGEKQRGSLFGHERITSMEEGISLSAMESELHGEIEKADNVISTHRQISDNTTTTTGTDPNSNSNTTTTQVEPEQTGWLTPEIQRIIKLTSIVLLLSIAVALTIGWLVILFLRCKYQREEKMELREQQKQQQQEQRRQKHLQRLVDHDESHFHSNNNNHQSTRHHNRQRLDYNDDDEDDSRSCFSNTKSTKSGMYASTRNKNYDHENIKQYHHYKLKSSSTELSFNHDEYYFSQKPFGGNHHRHHNQHHQHYSSNNNHHHNNQQRQLDFFQNNNNHQTSFFPISFQRNDFDSPYASSDVVYTNNNNRSSPTNSISSSGGNNNNESGGRKTYVMSNASNIKRHKKPSKTTQRRSPSASPSTRNRRDHHIVYDESGANHHIHHDNNPKHLNQFINNNNNNHNNGDDINDDDDNDSFALQLKSAIQTDHENFMRKQHHHDLHSTVSSVPKISPPKKDVAPIQIMDYMKDSLTHGMNYMQGLMYNHQSSHRMDSNSNTNNNNNVNGHNDHEDQFNNPTSFFNIGSRSGSQKNSYKDPETILTLTSTSGSSASTNTSSSYAGKNSSVEEDEVVRNSNHINSKRNFFSSKGARFEDELDDSGFQLISKRNNDAKNGIRINDSDEMNKYLLSNTNEDELSSSSFGNNSGMEMSLGGNTKNSGSNRSITTITSSVAKLGFHSIDDDKQELMYDYIPKDEYKAAVMAAAAILDKNTARNSKERGSYDTMLGQNADITTPRVSNALRKMTLSTKSQVENVPSDEARDNLLQRIPNDQFDEDDLDLDDTTATEDPIAATVTTNSSSLTVSTCDASSRVLATSSSDNNKLFKELKNVSIFLKRYEKKKSLKRQQRKAEIKQKLHHESSLREMYHDENQDDGYDPSYQESIDVSNSTSSPESLSPRSRERHQPSSSLNQRNQGKGGNGNSPLKSITTSRKQQRSNKTAQHDSFSKHEVQGNQQPQSLIASMKANRPVRQTRSPRSRYENGIQGQKASNKRVPREPIGLSPSLDSTTSDANFLETEIQSFFSQKDSSMVSTSMVSTSISEAASTTITNSSPPSPITRMPLSSQRSKYKEVEVSSANQSLESMNQSVSLNRLGAAPFDPLEPMAQSIGNIKMPDEKIISDGRRNSIQRTNDSMDEKFESTEEEFPSEVQNPDQSEEEISAPHEEVGNVKSASFIGGKAQNFRSMVAGLESKIENGAVSLVQRFNTKRSSSPNSTSSNSTTRKKVTFKNQAVIVNEASTTDAESLKNPLQNLQRSDLQATERNEPSRINSMISPSLINRIPGRKATPLSNLDIEAQDEDHTIQNEMTSENSRGASPTIVQRISPKINSTARSLISMFESKTSSSSPITPQNEYWQYTGKLKNNR